MNKSSNLWFLAVALNQKTASSLIPRSHITKKKLYEMIRNASFLFAYHVLDCVLLGIIHICVHQIPLWWVAKKKNVKDFLIYEYNHIIALFSPHFTIRWAHTQKKKSRHTNKMCLLFHWQFFCLTSIVVACASIGVCISREISIVILLDCLFIQIYVI